MLTFLCAACLGSLFAEAQCIPFPEAQKHVGATRCVSGTVLRVKQGKGGVHFLDYCED